jgi:hypothetical protein
VLRMGFFPDFKELNAVLVSADSAGIQSLYGAISQLTANPAGAVPVHEIARVSQKHPTSLFVTATLPADNIVASNTYYWVLPETDRVAALQFLKPLISAISGHQYFDLLPATASRAGRGDAQNHGFGCDRLPPADR